MTGLIGRDVTKSGLLNNVPSNFDEVNLTSATIFPAGTIHQVNTQGLRNTCLNSTSSGSFQISPTSGYARITPHKAGSKIFIQIICPCGGTDDEGGGGYNPYYHGFMKRSINGGSFSNADFLGQDNSQGGPNSHIELSPMGVTSSDNTTRWRYRTLHRASMVIDSPSYTLGQYIDYYLDCTFKGGSNYIQFGQPPGYSSDDAYAAQPWGFLMYEIAQ